MMNDSHEIKDLPDGLKKDLPFSVPEGYFENFSIRLRDKLETERRPGLLEKTYRILGPQLAIAATLAAFIIVGYAIIKFGLDNNRQSEPIQEYAEVIDYYIYDFDDETIMAVFTEENNLNYLNNTFEEEEIINYLTEDTDLDYTDLQSLY
jgi:hypothetical protein